MDALKSGAIFKIKRSTTGSTSTTTTAMSSSSSGSAVVSQRSQKTVVFEGSRPVTEHVSPVTAAHALSGLSAPAPSSAPAQISLVLKQSFEQLYRATPLPPNIDRSALGGSFSHAHTHSAHVNPAPYHSVPSVLFPQPVNAWYPPSAPHTTANPYAAFPVQSPPSLPHTAFPHNTHNSHYMQNTRPVAAVPLPAHARPHITPHTQPALTSSHRDRDTFYAPHTEHTHNTHVHNAPPKSREEEMFVDEPFHTHTEDVSHSDHDALTATQPQTSPTQPMAEPPLPPPPQTAQRGAVRGRGRGAATDSLLSMFGPSTTAPRDINIAPNSTPSRVPGKVGFERNSLASFAPPPSSAPRKSADTRRSLSYSDVERDFDSEEQEEEEEDQLERSNSGRERESAVMRPRPRAPGQRKYPAAKKRITVSDRETERETDRETDREKFPHKKRGRPPKNIQQQIQHSVATDPTAATRSGRLSKPVTPLLAEIQRMQEGDGKSYSDASLQVLAAMRDREKAKPRGDGERESESDSHTRSALPHNTLNTSGATVVSSSSSAGHNTSTTTTTQRARTTQQQKQLSLASVSKRLLEQLGDDKDQDKPRKFNHALIARGEQQEKEKEKEKASSVWQPHEMVALYAAHAKTPMDKPQFWELVSLALQEKGVQRSKEECEERWYLSVIDAQKRREKVNQRRKEMQKNNSLSKLHDISEQQRQGEPAKSQQQQQQKLAKKAAFEEKENDSAEDVEDDEGKRAKKKRMGKNDFKHWAEESAKATKKDDIFDAFPAQGTTATVAASPASRHNARPSLLMLIDSVPEIASPATKSNTQRAASAAERGDSPSAAADTSTANLFQSNHVHKIHGTNRIRPQLIAPLPTAALTRSDPLDDVSFSRPAHGASTQAVSIRSLEKTIGKAMEKLRDSSGESLGEEDTADEEEDEE